MKLLTLSIALGLASAEGNARIRKQKTHGDRILVDESFWDISSYFGDDSIESDIFASDAFAADLYASERDLQMSMSMTTTTPTPPKLVSQNPPYVMMSMSMSMGTSVVIPVPSPTPGYSSTPGSSPTSGSSTSSGTSTTSSQAGATPPLLPPVTPTFTDPSKEVVVVDIDTGSVSTGNSSPDTQGATNLNLPTNPQASAAAASSSVNVGGVVGSTIACIAALAGAALLIYKRRQDERNALPMTN